MKKRGEKINIKLKNIKAGRYFTIGQSDEVYMKLGIRYEKDGDMIVHCVDKDNKCVSEFYEDILVSPWECK